MMQLDLLTWSAPAPASPAKFAAAWTDDDNRKLSKLFFSEPRPTFEAMAQRLGRTASGVYNQLHRLGMLKPGAKVRRCRMCERDFFSEGAGNWTCIGCKQTPLYRYA